MIIVCVYLIFRAVRDVGGIVKLVKIAKGNYSPKVVKTANQVSWSSQQVLGARNFFFITLRAHCSARSHELQVMFAPA